MLQSIFEIIFLTSRKNVGINDHEIKLILEISSNEMRGTNSLLESVLRYMGTNQKFNRHYMLAIF